MYPLYTKAKTKFLVTHGASECWGTYNSTTELGYGAGYVNNCIHSGNTEHSGGDTTWYNYPLASAGTIVNKSAADNTGNTNTAIESVCPNGWTLPTYKQIDSNRSTSNFNPVLGGYYGNGVLYFEDTRGLWWGSEARNDGAHRGYLLYESGSLNTRGNYRDNGLYIRCVSEEKTVTDLTYMQDMTPPQSIGFK